MTSKDRFVRACVAVSPVVFASWLAQGYLATLGSMCTAVELGVGVTLMLAVHELGHIVALRRFGMRANPPAFIPLLGAVIVTDELDCRDPVAEGWVSIAGPAAGCGAALGVVGLYSVTGHEPFVLIAFVSFILNAFNLVPLPPLDGGRVAGAVTPLLWLVGFGLVTALLWWTHAIIAVVVLITGVVSAVARLRARSTAYYRLHAMERLALVGAYGATVAAAGSGLTLCVALGGHALQALH